MNDLIRRHGHESLDVRDTGLRGARDYIIASHARDEGLCLVTGDLDFSDVRNYPPGEYNGIVVLRLPRTATASLILDLMESFLKKEDLVARMPGKLAIVRAGRVRIRVS